MIPFPYVSDYRNKSMMEHLTDLALTSNLKICLDAGSFSSYGANTDKWLDLSGNGTDFFKGTVTGADAADPTFNGNIGNRSANEYFSSDGGDFFTLDSANDAWMETLHKDGAIWSFAAWVYQPSGAAVTTGVLGTGGVTASNGHGLSASINTSNQLAVAVYKGGSAAFSSANATALNTNAWNFVGWALSENAGANNNTLATNGSTSTSTAAYTSPSTAAAFKMQVGAMGNDQRPMINTARMASLMFWQGTKLSTTDYTNIYNRTKGRFGL